MKMNLSVVMNTIDQMSGPLKKITSTQSKFSKEISESQKALKDKTATMVMIGNYRKMGKEAGTAGDKLKVAQEKLGKLNAKMKETKNPSQALLTQFKKQQEQVKDLKSTHSAYTTELSKTQKKLKATGVDVNKLKSEEKRLNREHEVSIKNLKTMEARYGRLKKAANGLNKMHSFIKLPNASQVKSAGIGILGLGATITGYFGIINRTAGEMDHLSKTAQNLDMPVEELQAMQSQAEHAGVSADTMATAMGRYTKRFGVLQTTGAGAFGSFLKKGENPLFKQLETAKDTTEAYDLLLKSFGKLKTNQEQMAFADAAFGGDGRKMLIMLREGTEGLTKARKEFNELGGGAKTKDVQTAEAYNDALQRIGEAMESIKFAALTPIMYELTQAFTEFTDNFKKADWRKETLDQVKAVVKGIFTGIKSLGVAFIFITSHMPELIAGLITFKAIMLGITAIMLANPLGIIISGIALLVVGIGYLLQKTGMLSPVLESISEVFQRFGAGLLGIIGVLLQAILLIPRGIMKAVSLLPDFMLPDSWATAQKDIENFSDSFSKNNNLVLNYAVNGNEEEIQNKSKQIQKQISLSKSESGLLDRASEYKPEQINQPSIGMLKSPMVQSKSQVDVRIKSDLPVVIEKVKTDGLTSLNIDRGGLLEFGY